MHSSEVAAVMFTLTKFREGYAMADVDAFLERSRAALAQWEAGRAAELQAVAVAEVRFSPTNFRRGYDQDQVDDFLDKLSGTLADYEHGRSPRSY